MDNEELIAKISREVEHMCVTTGLNCAHDYDGIESKEDILLYLRAIHRLLPQKSIGVVYRDWETDRKSTRLNSSHSAKSRMPSSA